MTSELKLKMDQTLSWTSDLPMRVEGKERTVREEGERGNKERGKRRGEGKISRGEIREDGKEGEEEEDRECRKERSCLKGNR